MPKTYFPTYLLNDKYVYFVTPANPMGCGEGGVRLGLGGFGWVGRISWGAWVGAAPGVVAARGCPDKMLTCS